MRSNLIILLTVFVLALFQGAFLKLNFVLLLVFSLAVFQLPKKAILTAFFSGILLDLAKGMPLGFSSLIFLVLCYLLLLYSRKFDPLHPIFLPIFIFFASLVYNFIFKRGWYWSESLILALLALGLRYLLFFIIGRVDREQIKLR